MNQNQKKYVILGSLCAVILTMIVGYAAFNSVLNIKGTTNIASNWNIKITSIETKNIVKGASNAKDPEGIGTLTATLNTNLVSPGDSIEYDITITNSGNINATLEKITTTDSNNPAIKFTTSGLTEGSTLTANGGTAVLTVKVEYDSSVTSQPESTTSELQVTLDYVQDDQNNTVVPDDFTGTLYGFPNDITVTSFTSDPSLTPTPINNIETTSDYKTLNQNIFLKYNAANGQIKSVESCFIKNGGIYCLVGEETYEKEYSLNKATLLKAFGENACTIEGSGEEENISCSDGNIEATFAYSGAGEITQVPTKTTPSIYCMVGATHYDESVWETFGKYTTEGYCNFSIGSYNWEDTEGNLCTVIVRGDTKADNDYLEYNNWAQFNNCTSISECKTPDGYIYNEEGTAICKAREGGGWYCGGTPCF